MPSRPPPPPPNEQEVSVRWRLSRRDLEQIAKAMASGEGKPVRLRVTGELEVAFGEGGEVEIRARLSVVRPRS